MKRRITMVRVFPKQAFCLRLVSALLIEISQPWMERLCVRIEEEENTANHTLHKPPEAPARARLRPPRPAPP